ncbi:hypothetical protein HHA02_33770 [Cobetia marina]|nr:hypothetical protein HHA02_33770 [Cobetia marina]
MLAQRNAVLMGFDIEQGDIEAVEAGACHQAEVKRHGDLPGSETWVSESAVRPRVAEVGLASSWPEAEQGCMVCVSC